MTLRDVDATNSPQDIRNSQHQAQNSDGVSVTNEDDRDLLKLGYRSVLARGWGSFDNFACSFSALNCVGGIRVLFYIALSGGGPAAMYVLRFRSSRPSFGLITSLTTASAGALGSPVAYCLSSRPPVSLKLAQAILPRGPFTTGPSDPGEAVKSAVSSRFSLPHGHWLRGPPSSRVIHSVSPTT